MSFLPFKFAPIAFWKQVRQFLTDPLISVLRSFHFTSPIKSVNSEHTERRIHASLVVKIDLKLLFFLVSIRPNINSKVVETLSFGLAENGIPSPSKSLLSLLKVIIPNYGLQ